MEPNAPESIPKEKFSFVQTDARIRDEKPRTKPRGYFADAMIRFRKNKSSVVAAWILLCLVAFAVLSPILSPNDVDDLNATYANHPPFIRAVADWGLGILDGGYIHESQSETQLQVWQAMGEETGMNPVNRIVDTTVQREKYRGSWREVTYYKLENNKYYERGVVYRTLSPKELESIIAFQDETSIQVLYPYVEPKDIEGIKDNANIWYRVKDAKGTPLTDEAGNLIPAYSTNQEMADVIPYHSLRIEGDTGEYIYYYEKSGALHARVCYYNYYRYEQWLETGEATEPFYPFGTNSLGQCLFTAIGVGARFSLLFALIVSAINLTVGAVYGAVQGYYGGMTDMAMDRFADVLSGVPFVVVTTLFSLHFADRLPVFVSFAFAFLLTGWIGMAALTRKQFYRFKGQEFVLAAKTLGASDRRLMFKHIFPNSLGTLITSCALVIPGVINSEVNMTYLGIVNLQEEFGTSIGTLAAQGQTAMTSAPHAMLFPALFISLLLISFNLMGNGLRDAFNPVTRGVED